MRGGGVKLHPSWATPQRLVTHAAELFAAHGTRTFHWGTHLPMAKARPRQAVLRRGLHLVVRDRDPARLLIFDQHRRPHRMGPVIEGSEGRPWGTVRAPDSEMPPRAGRHRGHDPNRKGEFSVHPTAPLAPGRIDLRSTAIGASTVVKVWRHSVAKRHSLLVLLAIAGQADETGRTPILKNKDIALAAGVTPDRVERLTASLVRMGELEVVDQARGARAYLVTTGERA